MKLISVVFAIVALLTGCTAYHAPGGPASLEAMGISPAAQKAGTPDGIQARFDKKPLANFPVNVAFVRIQAPGYQSASVDGWGSGAFSVVLARDVESDESLERLRKLPMVRGLASIGRLLLPSQLNSDADLRSAAAQLQADMVLVYTFDTTFRDRDLASPISVITLGLSPTRATNVVTTASAVLLDTRNGYVYGLSEATARRKGLATAWNSTSAIDGDRKKTEEEAFEKLVGEIEKMWAGVIKENGPGAPRGGAKYPTAG